MKNLALENSYKKKSRKIPLIIILILLCGGIFLFWLYGFNYHRDSIDNQISDQIDIYSHWQIRKLSKNNAQLEQLFSDDKLKSFWPENFQDKLQNSSEFAFVYMDNESIFIFKPKQEQAFSQNTYKYNGLVFEGIKNKETFFKLLDNKSLLSNNIDYQSKKRFDKSAINVFIRQPKSLFNFKFFSIAENIPENTFWTIDVLENDLFIQTKNITKQATCSNSINNADFSGYNYYINNLSTENEAFLKEPVLLQKIEACIDLLIYSDDKWVILAEKDDLNQLKSNISSYLAYKYPVEMQQTLPDSSISTHIVAELTQFEWERQDGLWISGNPLEKYYLLEKTNYIILSNDKNALSMSSKHETDAPLTKCNENALNNYIRINNPAQFIFEDIQVDQTNSDMYICIH